MNVGRYLRGEDRHIGTARTTKPKGNEPMNMPLPCDVTVGHVTIRKGVALSVLVSRMQVLYDMAQSANAQPTQAPLPKSEALKHKYNPHKKYPWFCADCGYAEHELLMHTAAHGIGEKK